MQRVIQIKGLLDWYCLSVTTNREILGWEPLGQEAVQRFKLLADVFPQALLFRYSRDSLHPGCKPTEFKP